MKTIQLSKTVSLPLDAVTQTFGILAVKEAGKTYTALVMAEGMLKAHLQVVVLDPLGSCWGLRSSANGKGPGLPILVIGGRHGDLPLTGDMGDVLARLAAEQQLSMVLDMSEFRKAEQKRFVTSFAENLYHYKNEHPDPMMLILDEADEFAPQKPRKGEERLLGAFEDIVRRGRSRGMGVMLVTQRAAEPSTTRWERCGRWVSLKVGR